MAAIILIYCLFFSSGFIIFWTMIGYTYSIRLLGKLFRSNINERDYSKTPSVTLMIVAHNEEKVIIDKLNNVLEIDYPTDKIEFLVTSDNSTDSTNRLVNEFIDKHTDRNIKLYIVQSRKGKTNAQNEAHKLIKSEYTVMTDANSMLDKNAIKELMSSFQPENVVYVAGKLCYRNKDVSNVSTAESIYWERDLATREIESRIQSITAGNGALYACKTSAYYYFDAIKCHDSAMPVYYALQGKRAICNHDAIAYEKASEVIEDELKRKIRMNRYILSAILPDIRLLNIFKYKWFSYFYIGHRTFRYLLWISHLLVFVANVFLLQKSFAYVMVFGGQIIFCFISIIQGIVKTKCKFLVMSYHYFITVVAQWVGVYNIFTGKTKPFWEKAESTR